MTTDARAASLSHDEIVALLVAHDALTAELADLKRQVAWFQRQLFGTKSERRVVGPEGRQLFLGEMGDEVPAPAPTETVAAYQRRTTRRRAEESDTPLRFDPTVPVEEIRLPAPEGVTPETHEKVSEKTTERLAQRPGSYVVLRYVREVWKRKDDGRMLCPAAPAAVLERSLADVSLLAGLLVDKFQYHLPLYRQHQRMAAAGVHVTRGTLTNWARRTIEELVPIYTAQLTSILSGSGITMDETPIRAGREGPGTMHRGYFWPIYGDRDEVAFPFSRSRSKAFVVETLKGFGGTLLTDGYEVYRRYAERVNGLTHALCWSHYPENAVIRSCIT